VKKHAGGKRSLIITRSGYSGMQRYSSVWTGDNIATVEHLWLAGIQTQRLSISGVSFAGSDIGGFIEQPSGELFVRWIQLGIFHPFCRVHSSGDHGDQEPWSFGDDYALLFKEAVELRYQLLPYIYTSFYQYHSQGYPMIRPIIFYDQSDVENIQRDHEFVCGNDILAAPVLNQAGQRRNFYLPAGQWYSYWDNALYEGKNNYTQLFGLNTFPFFVQAGTVLPLYPVMQYVDEKVVETVTLKVYYKNGNYSSQYYDDAHDDYGYESGEYRLATFNLNGDNKNTTITQSIEGSYQGSLKSYKLELIGFPYKITKLNVDGKIMDVVENQCEVPSGFSQVSTSA